MSDIDELSAEESAAIEEMQSEPEAEIEAQEPEGPQEASEPEEAEPEEGKAEFKTTRDKPPEGFVPHQAMHEERVKRQEAERQLQAIMAAEQKRAMDAQAQAQEPQWVDPLIDPEGFKRYQDHQLQKTQHMVAQQQQYLQQRQMQEARQTDVVKAEQQFRQQTPDYDKAIEHIANARVAELKMYGLNEQAIQKQIQQDSNAIYDSARRLQMNPAQLVYQLAQQRGYTPQQAADEAAKVEARANAQQQTQGLGSGGARTAGRLTATQIAEMSETEIGKLSPEDIARAFGG